jgi:glycosyltransferase involved in cell wall biosynthesis
MKILQLISSAGFFGAENVVFELSRGLSSNNIENIIGVFENLQNPHIELVQKSKENNIEVKNFKCNGKIDIKTIYHIREFVKKNGVDILQSHGYKSNIYGFIVGKMLRKPTVSTCHNWIADDLKTKTYYRLDKYILSKFDKVIAVSEAIGTELLKNKVRKDRISLIYNGININRFDNKNGNLRDEFNISNKTMIIGTVARFTPEKGLFNLLLAAKEVMKAFSDVIFMFVGEGPLQDDLVKKTIELEIRERVIFTGMRSDMPEIYSTMDIFVLPSLKEGLPMVLLEAMAAKKPVIATKVGAVPTVVENMKDGIVITPGSIDELKHVMISLLENEELSKRLAENAFKKVLGNFSSKAMCDKYLEIYEEVVRL